MSDRVVVGVVGKPVGLRGEVYVRPDPDVEHEFPIGHTYQTSGRTLTVAATREHAGRLVVRFAEASDRDAAETLRGLVLTVERAEVTLAEDALWAADVLGAEVVDQVGELVGVVEGLLDGPAHDYLVVARTDGGEVLVPAVADLIEVRAGQVVIQAIPGLLDAPEP